MFLLSLGCINMVIKSRTSGSCLILIKSIVYGFSVQHWTYAYYIASL